MSRTRWWSSSPQPTATTTSRHCGTTRWQASTHGLQYSCRGTWSRGTERACRRAPCGTRRRKASGGTSGWTMSSSCGADGASRPTAATTRLCSGRSTPTRRTRHSCSVARATSTTRRWAGSGCTHRRPHPWAGSFSTSRRSRGTRRGTGGMSPARPGRCVSGRHRRGACPMCWAAIQPARGATASPPLYWTTAPGRRWQSCRCPCLRYSMPGRSTVWAGITTMR